MKASFFFSLLLILVCLLSACATPVAYREDATLAEVTESVRDRFKDLSPDSATPMEEYLLLTREETEYVILETKDPASLDEVGIFRTRGDADSLAEQLKTEYLSVLYERNHTFYDSYMAEETPKLKNAEVRQFGSYVVYAVLSEKDKATLFSTLEQVLRDG